MARARTRTWRLFPLLILIAVLATTISACGRRRSQAGLDPESRVRILVREEGLYRLTNDALETVGLDLGRLKETDIQLTSQGQPVPFTLTGRGAKRALIFYGRPSGSIYSPYNVYWLQLSSNGVESSLQPVKVSGAGSDAEDTARVRQRFEEQRLYLSTLPEGEDHWLWQPIYSRRSVAVTLALDGAPAPGEVSLEISLWSYSNAPVDPDHHVTVTINGVQVAEATWDGQGRQLITGRFSTELLQPGENQLTILAPGDTGASIEVSYLDWIELTYPRRLQAREGRLAFWASGGAYQVTDLPRGDVALWDVTDPAQPIPLEGFDVRKSGNRQTVRFTRTDTSEARRYQIAAGEGFLQPIAMEVRARPKPPRPQEGADYIAIVYPDFQEAIQPLLEYRAQQGLRVFTTSPEALYDAYTFGLPDPAAIRAFLADALRNWPEPRPRFVLLVGDASYDPYDYLNGPERNLIPSALIQTQFVGQTASDNWLADIDEDGRPDIALGRFPAQTPEQVQAMVTKTLRFEQQSAEDWVRRALMVADDKERYFIQMSEDLVKDFLADRFTIERVYLGQVDDPHARLLEAINQGVGLINYIGHGSVTVWAKEKILSTDDISALNNDGRFPLLVNMTCLTGYFPHPQTVSLSETLLRAPDRGVVAALVPTSESLSIDQRTLADAFFRQLTQSDAQTVGEVMMWAKQ